METIKNYLESMFRNLPKTDKVLRAKSELFQMMEDKYTELMENGCSENEAVGTVISEFGNLEELADDLGISKELDIKKTASEKSRKVSFEEINDFFSWRKKVPVYRGLGIACCICCVVPPIIFDGLHLCSLIGAILLFVMIAIGVLLIVFSSTGGHNWDFLHKEPCSIDEKTYQYVADKKQDFVKNYSIMTSVAIACFVLCFVPAIAFSAFNSHFFDDLGGALLFVFISAGVFLLVYANTLKSDFNFILNLNTTDNYLKSSDNTGKKANVGNNRNATDTSTSSITENPYYCRTTNSENREPVLEKTLQYKNPIVRNVLSVFWITVTCIYLSWSFLSFDWFITWIIWPIAAVVYTIIRAVAEKEEVVRTNDELPEK